MCVRVGEIVGEVGKVFCNQMPVNRISLTSSQKSLLEDCSSVALTKASTLVGLLCKVLFFCSFKGNPGYREMYG